MGAEGKVIEIKTTVGLEGEPVTEVIISSKEGIAVHIKEAEAKGQEYEVK